MTTLYNYDPITKELTGTTPAQVVRYEAPDGTIKEKELTQKVFSTTIAPPETKDGYTCRWTGTEWEQVEDHRQQYDSTGVKAGGTQYWLPGDSNTSVPRYMTELGPLPEDALLEAPDKTAVELFAALRQKRNARLVETDVYLVADYPITAENLEKVKAYRSALRDLPSLDGAPWDGGGEATPWPVLELN